MQVLLTNKTVEKLKYDLVREYLVDYDNMVKAEELALKNSTNLGFELIENRYISEKTLLEFVEQKLHIPYVDLDEYSLDTDCLNFVSEEQARQYKIIPLFKIENVLTVAMVDPLNLFVINSIIDKTEIQVEPIICSEQSILKAIETHYNKKPEQTATINQREFSFEILNDNTDENSIKNLIENIMKTAADQKIHKISMLRSSKGLNIKFNEQNKDFIPELLVPRFVSVLKNVSNLDEKQFEMPQLGKYRFEINDKLFTAVVSTFPSINGESVNIKIFEPPSEIETFFKDEKVLSGLLKKVLKAGFTLICGPDLSGKTLLVYSLISKLASSGKKILSIESKVKYELDGIIQSELNESTNFNLDKALKHIEFQSPDVVYIENISDKKYIEIFENLRIPVITEFKVSDKEELHIALNDFNNLNAVLYIDKEQKAEVI